LSLLCACTDTEMCRECKFTSDISRAYELTKRQLLRDWASELGIVATPYPADEPKGIAVVPKSAVCVGGRDVRDPASVGKRQPGDVVLHSTGPQNKT
jgi:hypothetical protein